VKAGLGAALLAFAAGFLAGGVRISNERPHDSQEDGNPGETSESTGSDGHQQKTDVLYAEWAAFQSLIGEIHKSEKEHQAAERNLGAAQNRTAKSLNWITGIGTAVGLVGSIGVIGSLIIAKGAADDARDALHKSQRPWVVAESAETFKLATDNDIYCKVGYKVLIKNTGNSVATNLLIYSRAISSSANVPGHLDDAKNELLKLWFDGKPPTPAGSVLAPGQDSGHSDAHGTLTGPIRRPRNLRPVPSWSSDTCNMRISSGCRTTLDLSSVRMATASDRGMEKPTLSSVITKKQTSAIFDSEPHAAAIIYALLSERNIGKRRLNLLWRLRHNTGVSAPSAG
jgi:hypothetical protein